MKRVKSESLYSEALGLMPGGVNSPVRAFRSVGGTPLFMKQGKGAHLIDEDGNDFIDYCMSWGPMILGHADADVVKAVSETAALGTSFGTPHRYEVELARIILDSYPSMDKIRFVNSGTEATMSAIRLARGYTGKKQIIKFDGCYHGHADFLLVAAGSGLATFGIPDSQGVTADNVRDTIVLPYNDLEKFEAYLKDEADKVAAVILEPVPCNYGLILPEKNYLKGVRKLCSEYGILLIFDEVINGFRLSGAGAQGLYDVEADLTTLGKIIGGGLPVGAYGGKKEIMDMVAPDGPVYQAGTLSGNPLAMAAGIATLKKVLSKGFFDDLRSKAGQLKTGLVPVLDKFKGRVLFNSIESIFSFSFTDSDKIRSVDQVRKCDMNMFASFHREMLSRGIYIAPSGFEVGFLSHAHSNEDISETVRAVTESLETVIKN